MVGFGFMSAALLKTKTTCVFLMQARRMDVSGRLQAACPLCLEVWRAMENCSGWGYGDAEGVISGFEGINPHSRLFA